MGDTPLATPTSPALSDDSDCLFRLDVDNVRSLLPQDITALPPVLKVINGGMVCVFDCNDSLHSRHQFFCGVKGDNPNTRVYVRAENERSLLSPSCFPLVSCIKANHVN